MSRYTTQLQAGLGLINETKRLLDLWKPGVDTPDLCRIALESGRFPTVSARRLRNIVSECFAPRYLVDDARPARTLKALQGHLPATDLSQLMFVYTCRANAILHDFVTQAYWPHYAGGHSTLDNDLAREFVVRANQDGKTTAPWSESTIRRVAAYLTGCCADFGLLEGARGRRKLTPLQLRPEVVGILAYDLHAGGLGNNAVVSHADWLLFGLERPDVLDLLRRLSLKDWLIIQSAGGAVRISWRYRTLEDLVDAITQG